MDFESRAPDERVVEGFAGRLEVIEGPSVSNRIQFRPPFASNVDPSDWVGVGLSM